MAMAKKSLSTGKVITTNPTKYPITKNRNFSTSPNNNNNNKTPDRVNSPNNSIQRTSPGLLAGHYAGCKFSEPPLPSSLPLPPQHWMQHQQINPTTAHPTIKHPEMDIAHQLKVLLKVQA